MAYEAALRKVEVDVSSSAPLELRVLELHSRAGFHVISELCIIPFHPVNGVPITATIEACYLLLAVVSLEGIADAI
jgi:hypothetical protein